MALILDLELLLVIAAANGAPLLAKRVLGERLAYPLDFHATLLGQRVLGSSKSFRGIVLAIVAAALVAPLLGLDWRLGALLGALAMAGDLISSFLKRRMKLPASSMALGLDQLPESLLPLLGASIFFPLGFADYLFVAAVFFAGELAVSRLLYRLNLRDRPY